MRRIPHRWCAVLTSSPAALILALAIAVCLVVFASPAHADEAPLANPDGGTDVDASVETPVSTTPPPPEADASTAVPSAVEPLPTPPIEDVAPATPTKTTSDIVAHAALEIGAYQDSVAVSVLTPSISARVENPIAGWGVNGSYLVDFVSAASPDIVSTASPHWTELRHAGNLSGRYKPGNYGFGIGVVTSYTPDYLALGANGQLIQDLDDKNLTLTEGYAFGHDVIGRTGTAFSVFSRKLDYHTISLGASRVVNSALVVGLFGDYIIERGDQSKPYRYIPIFSTTDAAKIPRGASSDLVAATRIQARPLEQLPLARERIALTGRVAWRLSSSTIRIEERGYTDTWGLHASTTDARWLFDLSDRVILWPHARLHVQNGVDFWQRAYSATSAHDIPAFRTGDRELSPLTNVGLGAGLRLALGDAGTAREDFVWTTTFDGIYTSFADAIYVKDRLSALLVTGLEVAF